MLTKVAKPKDAYTASAVSSAPARDLLIEAYREFIKAKASVSQDYGFAIDRSDVNPLCKPHQVDAICWAVRGGRRALFESFGLGKCHGAGTEILMAEGSIKRVEEIVVGDELMGDDGTPRRVLSLATGVDDLYRVTLKNGDSYICNSAHIFSLKVSNKYRGHKFGDIVDMSRETFSQLPNYAQRNCFKHYKVSIDFPSQPVPFDPYLYGAWLGDGHCGQLAWTINDRDLEIVHRIREFAHKSHLQVRELPARGCTSYFVNHGQPHNQPYPERSFIQASAPDGKRIDLRYLQNDRFVRLQLLAGLIDTDGYLVEDGCCFEVSTKWEGLRDDILYLARSLGLSVTHAPKTVNGATYYRIWISGETHLVPCLTRKKAQPRRQIKNPLVYGFTVESIGRGQYYGFTIDGNHRYLLADFTVTHNTVQQIEILRLIIKHAGRRGLIVAPLGVRQEFKRDARKLGLEITFVRSMDDVRQRELFDSNSHIYITNYETVREGKLDPSNFTVTSLDEAAVLRGFGGTKTFREFMRLFEAVPYRFVATATPDPNTYIELLAYAAYLGISDVSGAKTRFFKRDSTKADNLVLHPHKEEEFWLWVSSWGLFLDKPSDLGHADDGYDLPPLEVVYHEIPAERVGGSFERDGQQRMFRDALMGVVDAAREKRDTLDRRVAKLKEIIQGEISATRRPTEEIGVSQSVLRQEQGAAVSDAKRERCPATGGNQGIPESLSREEQEAAFGRAESANGEALLGEQGALQRKEQAVAGGESGKIQKDDASLSPKEPRQDQLSQSEMVCREQAEGERNQSQEQIAEIWPDSRAVRGFISQAGRALPDLSATDEAVSSGSRPQNWCGQGAAMRGMQCGSGAVSGESGDSGPGDRVPSQFIVWCDLNDEQRAIDRALDQLGISYSSLYGAMSLEEREAELEQWRRCETTAFVSKPVMYGAGINLQQCSTAIFFGIGFKFSEFLQAIKRIHRFLQNKPVKIHLIYAESERGVLENLKRKWEQHKRKVEKMAEIIREFGLSQQAMIAAMQRQMGVERVEVLGDNYRLINNDCVEELYEMADNSIGLVLTSWPFSTQYEYTNLLNDFGHNESNAYFFQQLDFMTPQIYRVLQPGRIYAVHVKDRIVPGGLTGLGFQTVYPFHLDAIRHCMAHGFAYMGMKTIVTDVVRENNQTYRLGWTEQCKDGTKMGVGMPEYLLLFRKPPTDTTNSYADLPVVKEKAKYSRSRWQIDAHGFGRSNGNRPPKPEELESLQHQQIFKIFRDYSLNQVYDFEYHVRIGEALERKQRLPVTFMLLQPASWHPDVWSDITRMRTLNGAQSAKGKQMHLCPMQLDLAERAITQWSMEGEAVLDPFAGLGTVPMVAVKLGRKGIGIELNPNYFADGCLYVESAAREIAMPTLFDVIEGDEQEIAESNETVAA